MPEWWEAGEAAQPNNCARCDKAACFRHIWGLMEVQMGAQKIQQLNGPSLSSSFSCVCFAEME
jgi:hypothetical protein